MNAITDITKLKFDEEFEKEGERKKIYKYPNNIRFYRKKYGYTQEKLQNEWNIAQQTISKYETGETKTFRPEDIKKIITTFSQLSYDELFNTGRLSICINKKNQKLLKNYLVDMKDVFPLNNTEYENTNIIVNHILKIFLESKLSMELQSALKDDLEANK